MSKGQNEFQPINPLWVVIFAVAVAIIISQVANADEDYRKNINQTVDIAGDSSKALGLAQASLPADIGDCIAIEGTGFLIVYQETRVVENLHCIAIHEHRIGNHDTEARVKCGTSILKSFDDFDACYHSQMEHVRNAVVAPESVSHVGMQLSDFQDLQMLVANSMVRQQELEDENKRIEASRQRAANNYAQKQASDRAYALEILQQVKELE